MNIEINHLTKIYRGDVYALNDHGTVQVGQYTGANKQGRTAIK